MAPPPLLYLDQNHLSGIAKGKPAFAALEPALRAAIPAGAASPAEPGPAAETARDRLYALTAARRATVQ